MRIGSIIYHCPRTSDESSEVTTYGPPVRYVTRFNYITVQPASGDTDTLQYGERVTRYWNGMANYLAFKDKFKEGDLFYLDGRIPETDSDTYVNGDGANALLTSVRMQNRMIKLSFEKVTE